MPLFIGRHHRAGRFARGGMNKHLALCRQLTDPGIAGLGADGLMGAALYEQAAENLIACMEGAGY